MRHQEILAEHVVDIHKGVAHFRDAFERIQSSSSQSYGVNKYFSSQSPVQKRLSIYNWNPGPWRGKEDTIEKQCTSAIFMPRKKGTAMKIIQTLRAIMISQDVDLVAGDFNGTAWRCRSRDNLSTIDEVFADCLALAAGPPTIVETCIQPEHLC